MAKLPLNPGKMVPVKFSLPKPLVVELNMHVARLFLQRRDFVEDAIRAALDRASKQTQTAA